MTKQITTAERNDVLRQTFLTGKVVLTSGVAALGDNAQKVITLVREFNTFTGDNDPYGEHDFGKVTFEGVDYFWKIDDYRGHDGLNLVLTIMRADEY